jgi:D-sedoheptulose 7-phosphate isomerase
MVERVIEPEVEFFEELSEVLLELSPAAFTQAAELLFRATVEGRRIYSFGNGGSATTASHLVCDLTKTARLPGLPAARASALTDNVASLTAWGNDAAFESVFAEQLASVLEPGDVAFAISVSGRSPNVVLGLEVARDHEASTVLLTGGDLPLAYEDLADVVLQVPSSDFGVVESAHVAIVHALVRALTARLQGLGDLIGSDLD